MDGDPPSSSRPPDPSHPPLQVTPANDLRKKLPLSPSHSPMMDSPMMDFFAVEQVAQSFHANLSKLRNIEPDLKKTIKSIPLLTDKYISEIAGQLISIYHGKEPALSSDLQRQGPELVLALADLWIQLPQVKNTMSKSVDLIKQTIDSLYYSNEFPATVAYFVLKAFKWDIPPSLTPDSKILTSLEKDLKLVVEKMKSASLQKTIAKLEALIKIYENDTGDVSVDTLIARLKDVQTAAENDRQEIERLNAEKSDLISKQWEKDEQFAKKIAELESQLKEAKVKPATAGNSDAISITSSESSTDNDSVAAPREAKPPSSAKPQRIPTAPRDSRSKVAGTGPYATLEKDNSITASINCQELRIKIHSVDHENRVIRGSCPTFGKLQLCQDARRGKLFAYKLRSQGKDSPLMCAIPVFQKLKKRSWAAEDRTNPATNTPNQPPSKRSQQRRTVRANQNTHTIPVMAAQTPNATQHSWYNAASMFPNLLRQQPAPAGPAQPSSPQLHTPGTTVLRLRIHQIPRSTSRGIP